GDEPYTRIEVEPGNISVREGESAVVTVRVEGRTGKHVTFSSRRADEDGSNWREESLSAKPSREQNGRQWEFEVPLDRIRHPLEYRVSAGSVSTDTYRVDVLLPLKIIRVLAKFESPEYTGLPETTI